MMASIEHLPRRKAIRLRGFDYAQPGAYFVTICTRRRRCVFGSVKDGDVILSRTGTIADAEWRGITEHRPEVTLDTYRVMPNHIHGIIVIERRSEGRSGAPGQERRFASPIGGSLSSIIGGFKSGVTRKCRAARFLGDGDLWQPRFYDHIIRDDRDYFMIQQYIELNPVMWEYDMDNPRSKTTSFDQFTTMLEQRYGITGQALYMIVNSKKFNRLNVSYKVGHAKACPYKKMSCVGTRLAVS